MSTINTPDQPIDRKDVPFLKFLISLPGEQLQSFCRALQECSSQIREDVLQMLEIADDDQASQLERSRALMTIADQLHLLPTQSLRDNEGRLGMGLVESEGLAAAEVPALAVHIAKMDSQEADFAERLRNLMKTKHITQKELAKRIECSQPAISQMLNRKCRPQRKTLLKLATALNVDVRELWPDLEVAERLDTVAAFQEDGYVMTAAEAAALKDTAQAKSRIKGRSLPSRKSNRGGK